MKCPNYIPLEMRNKAIELKTINEIGWRRNELIELLNFLKSNKKAILGGDVYTYKSNKLDTLGAGGANWSVNRQCENESFEDFAMRSIEETFNYLKKLPETQDFIFSVIFYD